MCAAELYVVSVLGTILLIEFIKKPVPWRHQIVSTYTGAAGGACGVV